MSSAGHRSHSIAPLPPYIDDVSPSRPHHIHTRSQTVLPAHCTFVPHPPLLTLPLTPPGNSLPTVAMEASSMYRCAAVCRPAAAVERVIKPLMAQIRGELPGEEAGGNASVVLMSLLPGCIIGIAPATYMKVRLRVRPLPPHSITTVEIWCPPPPHTHRARCAQPESQPRGQPGCVSPPSPFSHW
jgi:hypothetical protein